MVKQRINRLKKLSRSEKLTLNVSKLYNIYAYGLLYKFSDS